MAIQYTQGEWRISGTHKQYVIGDRWVCHTEDHRKNNKECEANAALICDAVNNTVGKGIDPNAVAGLLKALQHLCKTIRPHVMKIGIKKGFSEHVALTQAEKAINKAINS